MTKKAYLIIMIVCILASLSGVPNLVNGIIERGFSRVNYGVLIPVCIGICSFIKWKKTK